MLTGLKSDDFCGYNISAAPFYWTFEPGQYENTYAYGEVGVNANGGGPGSYMRADVVDVDSFLSGRDQILTKCTPPTPSLGSLNRPVLHPQPEMNVELLQPVYSKEKRSSNGLDAIDYNRFNYLYSNPQNLRHVIEEVAPQRGGMATQEFVKSSWNQYNNSNVVGSNNNMGFLNAVSNGPTLPQKQALCQLSLDPNRVCGPECEGINGYPGVNPLTGQKASVSYIAPGKPPGDSIYPFNEITSQQLFDAGAAPCGPTFFNGVMYNNGSCPVVNPPVLNNQY